MLEAAAEPLSVTYDLAMLDLDGVVYIGDQAVPGAPAHLEAARRAGLHLAFITNNASRPPEQVAHHLRALGIPATGTDVVTSAQAAAHVVAERFGAGARIFLLGGDGLEQALLAEDLVPVSTTDPAPVAVVSGYGPDLPWRRVMQGAVLIRDGLPWIASNTDLTIPTSFGLGPGHGVMVQMLQEFSGVAPVVAGKPERPLLDETVRRVGGRRPLMVGDRLDTDIEGAANAGVDSLLVMTGVTGLADLVAAPPRLRPTYLTLDLGGLTTPQPAPQLVDGEAREAGWTARVDEGRLLVDGSGPDAGWWRVAATAAWAYADRTGRIVQLGEAIPPSTAPEGSLGA